MSDSRNRDATILMIQWAIWKHLGHRIIMDGERMQQLAEQLAYDLYAEGVRMPLDDHEEETPLQLTCELLHVSKEIGPAPLPDKAMRERARKLAVGLYRRGWRKFSEVA